MRELCEGGWIETARRTDPFNSRGMRGMAVKERGGRLQTEVVPNVKKATLRDVILRNVAAGSIVSTDELMSYGLLTGDGYKHGTVKHGPPTVVSRARGQAALK